MSRKVISGHGSFNENFLALDRRNKLGKFVVPAGVTLTMYAPHGAKLENQVANAIEVGNAIATTVVKLSPIDGGGAKTLPKPYPYVFTAGSEVVDYTVSPPDGLSVRNNPYTVTEKTALRAIVKLLADQGYTDLHYACCGSGFSDSPKFTNLFPFRGYYVSL